MPVTSRSHDRNQTPAWITLASMFVGHRLDKWSAVGAYVAAAVTVALAAIAVLAFDHH